MVLRNFLDDKVFFLHVTIVLTCFQSEKSQNKPDLMQNFLLHRFTKLVKMNFKREQSKKKVRLSNFEFSLFLNLYQSTILHLDKTFRIETFKKSIKIARKAAIMNDFSVQI